MIAFGGARPGTTAPGIKRFLSEVREGVVPQTIWHWKDAGSTRNAKQELSGVLELGAGQDVFVTPKPSKLVQRILQIVTDKDSIVLDSFAGSGTTAQAVLALNKEDGGNRRFVLIECEDYADTITAERVRRVIQGVPSAKDEALKAGYGGTFSYFELGSAMRRESILDGSKLPTYEKLAAYIFFTATGEEFDAAAIDRKTGFIGSSRLHDMYLIYADDVEKLKDLALTLPEAQALPAGTRNKLVFAPTKYVGSGLPAAKAHRLPATAVRNLRVRGAPVAVILKEFQKRVVATVRDYLEQLHDWRERAEPILEHDADYDWVAKAWPQEAPSSSYLPRKNGKGQPLPTFCLKVPTGGGKTLLAIKIIDLVNVHYRRRQTGLVLWIVPSTQIYNQTLRALKDRDHPYRQQLDVSSAGHTTILEKTNAFTEADVRENLCVLLLMLPSANRETKESLRMFPRQRRLRALLPARGRRRWAAGAA